MHWLLKKIGRLSLFAYHFSLNLGYEIQVSNFRSIKASQHQHLVFGHAPILDIVNTVSPRPTRTATQHLRV